jgi:hypothetical protein
MDHKSKMKSTPTPTDDGMGNSYDEDVPIYETQARCKLCGILYNDPIWGPKYRQRVKSMIGPGRPFDPVAINEHLDRLHTVLKPAVSGKNLIQQAGGGDGNFTQSPQNFAKAVDLLKSWVASRPKKLLSGSHTK